MSEEIRTISEWVAARLPVVLTSLQAEIVAGNTVKESRERAALAELRAIEQQLPKFDAELAALRDEVAAAHKHAADLTEAHEAEVERMVKENKRVWLDAFAEGIATATVENARLCERAEKAEGELDESRDTISKIIEVLEPHLAAPAPETEAEGKP